MAPTEIYKGKIVSGAGHMAARMTEGSAVMELYERETGVKPVPGTLNVMLETEIDMPTSAREIVRRDDCGETVIYITPARVNEYECFAVRSKQTEEGYGRHAKNIIELISPHHLRTELRLRDGDSVTVSL